LWISVVVLSLQQAYHLTDSQPPSFNLVTRMISSKKILTAAVALLLVCGAQAAFAQPGPGGPPLPAAVPLDGGIGLLVAAGAAFGLRTLRRK
jgi:hypothetical protein